MPAARSPRRRRWRRRCPASGGESCSLAQPRAQLIELLERLKRAEGIGLNVLELLAQWIRRHLDRQAKLPVRGLERTLPLQLGEDLAGAGDNTRREAGQSRHVDAI